MGKDSDTAVPPPRPVPMRGTSARLIYQTWQRRMCEIDQGHMVYDWNLMPGEVRRVWEDAVSAHINWLYEGVVTGLADRLSVRTHVENGWAFRSQDPYDRHDGQEG